MRLSKEEAEFLRELADRYSRLADQREYVVADAVDWARSRGELSLSPNEEREVLIGRMSEALRTDTVKDRYGRAVRLRHCLTVPKAPDRPAATIWAHIDEARDEFLLESLRQRRGRIAADVEALRADLDFINGRRVAKGLRPIQMTIDDYRIVEHGRSTGTES